MAETRQLSLHPLAIHTFIKAQAGSLGKALSEAVMNSVDAFANNIDITLSPTGFEIVDDGQGFRDRDEIAAWFETLGFPHDDGNHRQYGKFGMGRAQMWAFARTTWRSNQFVMKVDVKKTGLDYELDEGPAIRGTTIEGEFYEPMAFQRLTAIEMELENLVRYVPALITINEKVVSKNPAIEKWDIETPEAWMRFNDKAMHTLDVYNAGVLVAHFPRYRFGCTGVVITKPGMALSLNVARNDVLEAECKIWPKLVKLFPKDGKKAEREKPVKASKRALEQVVREVKAGTRTLTAALKAHPELIISVYGRSIDLSEFTRAWGSSRPIVFAPKGDDFAKRLSKLKRASTVASETLAMWGFTTPAELKAMLRKVVESEADSNSSWGKAQLERFDERVWSAEPSVLFSDLNEGKNVFANGELDDAAKCVQIAWRRNLVVLRNGLNALKLERVPYNLALGDCPSRAAWVSDGNELVLRKADAVAAMNKPFPEVLRYVSAVAKEVLEQDLGDDREAGQRLFMQLATETDTLARFAVGACASHVGELRKLDAPIPKTRLRDFDEIQAE